MDISDYNSIQSSLIFSLGSSDGAMRCENVTIIDDSVLEGDQSFTLTLNASDPSVILSTPMTTIIITDDDG